METCGEYELDKAIGWGRRSTFFAARAINDRGPALIVIRRARTAERTHRHEFLRAAAEQQAAVIAGCRRLAAILVFDCDRAGFAFYATTRYERSLAESLEWENKVDSALLRETVAEILTALAELQEKSRRAHGNLTPGNILLDPQGRIFLTDLAPSAKHATTADDLFALGTLIYELVQRKARPKSKTVASPTDYSPVDPLRPPLDYSPAWTESVGDDAEGWLAFTNRLLEKPRNASPDAIKSALADLHNLKKVASVAAKAALTQVKADGEVARPVVRRVPPKKKNPLPLVLAAILILGGGGGGYFYWNKIQAEKRKQRITDEEIERIKKIKDRLPLTIRNLREDLKNLPPDFDKRARTVLGLMEKGLDGSTTVEGVLAAMNSKLRNWELPDELKKQSKAWRSAPREWTRLANEADADAEVDTKGETPIVEQFQKVLAARSAAAELDVAWEEITRMLDEHRKAGNRLLPDFTGWAEGEIRSVPSLKDAAKHARDSLEKLGAVFVFQRDFGSRVDWVRFEKEAAGVLEKPGDDVARNWPLQWRDEAKKLVVPEKKQLTDWRKVLADVAKRIQEFPAKDPNAKRLQDQLDKLSIRVEAALETEVALIDTDLRAFAKFANSVELPEEAAYKAAHRLYQPFLDQWKKDVADLKPDAPGVKDAAKALLKKFSLETADILKKYPKYPISPDPAGQAKQMEEFLKKPDRIAPQPTAPGWSDNTPPEYNSKTVLMKYTKDGKETPMPFIALNQESAMAAWETTLVLARLSGAKGSPPRDGPKIRNADFTPAAESWLWKAAADILTVPKKRPSYFAAGVTAGDVGSDYLPATWLSFDEASAMAKALGGRLPTATEWRLANANPGAEKRLRSRAAWAKQYPLVQIWENETKDHLLSVNAAPNVESFSKGMKTDDTDRTDEKSSDGRLWLAMGADPKWKPTSGFTHLIGNAAEWVNDNESPAVMGGSVVSPLSLSTTDPIPLARNGSFFDVTFRLVIPIAPGGAGEGLRKFMEFAQNEVKLPPAPKR